MNPVPKFSEAQAAPLAITSANCESHLGLEWRMTRRVAATVGVAEVRIGTKVLIPARELLQALLLHRISTPATPVEPEPGSADELQEMRDRLRAGGGRRG